jgi:hypothetical protein
VLGWQERKLTPTERSDRERFVDTLRTCCKAARTLAISALTVLERACSGVRYSVVWPAWLAALPTAASSSGRLVMASSRPPGCAARQYQLHQL